LQAKGTLGLIATNTVAQGDSREVGLDAMVDDGFTITRAIQSRSWPAASANLEYAAVWGTRGDVAGRVPRVSDDVAVRRASTLLELVGRVDGIPARLAENSGTAFIGCYVLGMGFVLDPAEAQEWIAADARNAEVVFPYLNGEDLNSRPDTSASRWIIDFNSRSEAEAASFHTPFDRVVQTVKPERAKVNMASRRERWWQYGSNAPAMREAIAGMSEVLVISRVSKTVMPTRVPTGQVFSDKLDVFATDSYSDQAVLSSSLHQLWAIRFGATMRADPAYTPSTVFEPFPRPQESVHLQEVGRALDVERREIMARRGLGLTRLYNLVNDSTLSDDHDPDVAWMRSLHARLDEAVAAAYGWSDVALEHGFHSYRQVTRWTVSPRARDELLGRLLEENMRRASQVGAPGASTDSLV